MLPVAFAGKFRHLNDDVNAGLADCPVVGVFGLLRIKDGESVSEELPGDQLGNDRKVLNGLFAHLDTSIIS